MLKGLLGGAIGLLIGTIGISPIGGESRFTFGWPPPSGGGISLIVALIGLFVIPELLNMMRQGRAAIDSTAGLGDGGFRFGGAMRTVFSKPVEPDPVLPDRPDHCHHSGARAGPSPRFVAL